GRTPAGRGFRAPCAGAAARTTPASAPGLFRRRDRRLAERGGPHGFGPHRLAARNRGADRDNLDRHARRRRRQERSVSAAPASLAQARALLLSPLGPVARAGQRDGAGPRVSFEFFPPKTDKAEENLWSAIRRLEPLNPAFVSVTYGAGGSTRERTHRTVCRILSETSLKPAAHLTCVEASRDEVDQVIRDYKAAGVRHIVALRGDPPGAAGIGGAYTP